jgi:hypothetical protein
MFLNRLHFRSTSPSEGAATLDGRAVRNLKGRSRAIEAGTGAPLMVDLIPNGLHPQAESSTPILRFLLRSTQKFPRQWAKKSV